jgi:hypothetical protein
MVDTRRTRLRRLPGLRHGDAHSGDSALQIAHQSITFMADDHRSQQQFLAGESSTIPPAER